MTPSAWDYGPGNRDDYTVSPANKEGANQFDSFLASVGQGFGQILGYGITRAIDDPNGQIQVANTLPRVGSYYSQPYQTGYAAPGASLLSGNNLLLLLAAGVVVFLIAKS